VHLKSNQIQPWRRVDCAHYHSSRHAQHLSPLLIENPPTVWQHYCTLYSCDRLFFCCAEIAWGRGCSVLKSAGDVFYDQHLQLITTIQEPYCFRRCICGVWVMQDYCFKRFVCVCVVCLVTTLHRASLLLRKCVIVLKAFLASANLCAWCLGS
jgi:hypothetical protein